MAKFAILGSSYISRLRDFCEGDFKVPGDCRFFGKGGMRTDSIPHWMMADLESFNPDVVFVHLGGNDIRRDSSPKDIFSNLCAIVETLKKSGAKVHIAEICRRGDFSKAPGLMEASFNRQRNAINRLLIERYGKCIVKIPLQYPADYDNKLVHFSDYGIRKYFFMVRRVFLRC
ncbi:uncharacterized protein LOC117314669 [Pecten maximus]|uniref:uncharacterized protein LOC117314669 n=1 Tax=Pecten maximus TaxID=6579 RepID=UPI001458366A|nr:uncharacterized protein LOC117314669 [Pecten maximus]